VMPPPGTALPGSATPPMTLDDAKIAEAITYARANFGNNASAVDAELVKKVRDSLAGRTTPWTATELTALRTGASAAGAAAAPGTAPAKGAVAPATGAQKARTKTAQRAAVPAR
jgi:hypothetical protein